MRIKELRLKVNMSQSAFAKEFHIPLATLQQWEQGRRVPPDYVCDLIERIMRLEDRIIVES